MTDRQIVFLVVAAGGAWFLLRRRAGAAELGVRAEAAGPFPGGRVGGKGLGPATLLPSHAQQPTIGRPPAGALASHATAAGLADFLSTRAVTPGVL